MTAASRRSRNGAATATAPTVTRVAIYCRQSVTRGDEGGFGSIAAQREAVEAYVASQKGEGWRALPARYDDANASGAGIDRPALQRLLDDVRAGHVDVVACYKLDRLSRSLLDFARLMALFEEHDVAFTSITQAFNSATSMGRLTLGILTSFAQFERETIAERTRDKMLASRRRGMWTGGRPPLGLDVVDGRLVTNAAEAAQVRRVFEAYLEHRTLMATLAALRDLGITNKAWTNKAGNRAGGSNFDKLTLRNLLANPLLIGKIRAGGETVDGQHEAVIERDLWDRVQAQLAARAAPSRPAVRATWNTLLGGILFCWCGRSMGHSFASRDDRRYRYYRCQRGQKEGAAACRKGRVSAPAVEEFVVSKLCALGADPELERQVLAAAGDMDQDDVRRALRTFDELWNALDVPEQNRIVHLLVERVVYDGRAGEISVTLRPNGLRAFAEETA